MDTGIGQTLRDAREDRGRSLEDVARVLRLRTDQLRALEEERFDGFGGDVYARGFLKSYALELGLDPQPLLDIHRREYADEETRAAPSLVGAGAATTPPRRSPPPVWLAWVLVAVVVIAGLGIVGTLGGGRAPEVASDVRREAPPAPVDGEDVDAADDDGAADDADGSGDPTPDDDVQAEPPEPEGVQLLLALEDRSWMRVTVDGTVVFEQVAEQGELLRYDGEEEITIRFGDAGVVRVEVNGEDLGVPGGRGQVADVTYTPDGPADDV